MPPESAKRLFCFQETRRCPTHGHDDIAVVCNSATHTSDHRVRRFDHIGGGQAARQLSGHTKSVDCEQLLQSFKQAGSGIRMLRLQMFGVRFEFLDADIGVPFERLGDYPASLRRFGLEQALGNIAYHVNLAALPAGGIPAHLINGRAQGFRSIDHPRSGDVHIHAALGQAREKVLDHPGVLAGTRNRSQHVFGSRGINTDSSNQVMPGNDDAVHVDRHQISIGEITSHHFGQRLHAIFDEMTRYRASGNTHLVRTRLRHPRVGARC